jgi:arsenate reductase-like glutaredoxin family protein
MKGLLMTMNDEIDDEILDAELEDDALEKKMRKLESEATRILNQSNELIREMNKGKENQKETEEQGEGVLAED